MTSSADLTAAGGAWVAIGIMDDKDLHDEDTTAWTQRLRTRAGLNDIHDMVGGASLCWGSKDERTVFAGEAIALLMAMRSLRLEHERAGVELPQTVCPIDNSGVVRKYKRILQKTQQELATEAARTIPCHTALAVPQGQREQHEALHTSAGHGQPHAASHADGLAEPEPCP